MCIPKNGRVLMNDFIGITNQVIAENLTNKVHLSNIEYMVIDQVYVIKVIFYTLEFEYKAFSFMECKQDLDKDILKMKFECFIDDLKI